MPAQQLKTLVDAIQKLSLARDIDTVTDVVRTAARKLTGADGAAFVLKDVDKCYYANEDAIAPLWKGQRFPLSACISGWSMINKKWVAIEDIYQDDRIPVEAYKPTFVKSLAMVPIRTMEPIGAIGNYWAHQHAPTIEEMELLQTLADITSVSIENVYAFNELKEQNQKLYEIAIMQSHQVRVPIAQIQGLFNLFHFEDPQHADNPEVFNKLKIAADAFDGIIKNITELTSKIKVES
jgi:GAF domain-containing protein